MEKQWKMKWFKFLIYVELFLSAVSSLFGAYLYLTGAHYGTGMADAVYTYYGMGLRVFDRIIGVYCIALAVFTIIVRQRLAKYKAGAPALYLTLLVLRAVYTLVYIVGVYRLTGIFVAGAYPSQLTPEDIFGAIFGFTLIIAAFFANKTYFDKRASLFVN